MKKPNALISTVVHTVSRHKGLTAMLLCALVGSVLASLVPPLVLERIVNTLAEGKVQTFAPVMVYFLLLALSGVLDAGKESLITVFGQKVTHQIRSAMCRKLKALPADYYTRQDTGTTVSRFVNDVDTVEALFTSGIISMIADVCRIISILAVIFVKSPGLGLLLLPVLPLMYWLTRVFQKKMLCAQLDNRKAVGRANNHIPDTLRSIRMIHNLGKEDYMRRRYDEYIQQGFRAVNRSNFYDAVYSPIINMVSAVLVAVMMILSARGGWVMTLFGMSVGTAVAVISFVGKIFEPLENIGMEIQNIQSAAAGVRRINAFLEEEEMPQTHQSSSLTSAEIRLEQVHFGYEKGKEILHGLSLQVMQGEQITLIGRTGAGKSTVFKLLLGLYRPWSGSITVCGCAPENIPERDKRKMFGYVEQGFRPIPGTILDQITLGDPDIRREDALLALETVGLSLSGLPEGVDTPYHPGVFSQGQIQLLSIARAIAANPQILLLDEITANLDAQTEQKVLFALRCAAGNRTMLSISHRLYECSGGKRVEIPWEC